ncbi:late competence protein ComER [Desertibacillus haloalkaliphilus]|uniref:late competence protein ComER n=1 Tax=Desertibacillus haloalkaliphilus TaxID=1328930 RepID=UPI001C2682AA|nr:late competence protein ComER [Desertibacillus haloalkaliphilus]MBU8905616.1 late competence protein ComER [Desertibacillus haloalkaliphilus]
MRIGVIGTGSMGKILIDSFIESNAINPSQLTITNRTLQKADEVKSKYPGITVANSPEKVIDQAEIIFICVKPLQFESLLMPIRHHLSANQILISITSPISVTELETIVDCKVARAIPSITNRALAGSVLLSFGDRCNSNDRLKIKTLLEHIATPLEIEENITRVSSDIVSCGPAFFSYLLQGFIDAAVRQTDITKEQATALTTEMMIGLGNLLEKGVFTLPALQERVCVPGGITGEGIKVLEEELGEMFDHLFEKTHAKYYEDRSKISKQFKS